MSLFKNIIQKFSGKKHTPSKRSFEEKYNDIGVFQYDADGFTITYEGKSKTIKWNDITELNAYKIDQMTIDRIDMAIVFGDRQITISEDLPGWYQFIFKTKSRFPSIPKDWELKIMHPAFAENFTNIYKREAI
jgi:hypothetical protein